MPCYNGYLPALLPVGDAFPFCLLNSEPSLLLATSPFFQPLPMTRRLLRAKIQLPATPSHHIAYSGALLASPALEAWQLW